MKLRAKRENAMRPLSKIFQNMNRKKRGGSDGTADIDTVSRRRHNSLSSLNQLVIIKEVFQFSDFGWSLAAVTGSELQSCHLVKKGVRQLP